VRESAYTVPNQEPCNFVEFTMTLSTATNLTYSNLLASFSRLVLLGTVKKLRITSIVVDPVVLTGSATVPQVISQAEVSMGLSGNTYWFADAEKPLRIRFREEYAKDGMWHILNSSSLDFQRNDPIFPDPTTNTTINVLTLSGPTTQSFSTEVRFRIAWSDIGEPNAT